MISGIRTLNKGYFLTFIALISILVLVLISFTNLTKKYVSKEETQIICGNENIVARGFPQYGDRELFPQFFENICLADGEIEFTTEFLGIPDLTIFYTKNQKIQLPQEYEYSFLFKTH